MRVQSLRNSGFSGVPDDNMDRARSPLPSGVPTVTTFQRHRGVKSVLYILSEVVCVKQGSSGYQAAREGQDLIGSCPAKAMILLKDSPKATLGDFLIDSTMNGSEDLPTVWPPPMGTFLNGMFNFQFKVS